MSSFKRTMLSVNALVTFEAALRLKSFTAAAGELNVTQAAVSRQVRMLEEELGVKLFKRGHRRVEPTAAGAVLGATLSQSFTTISDAIEMIRRPSESDTLTVGASVAFSHFWLLPRLSSFRRSYPDVNIRVVSQDSPFDLRAGDVDVAMRYGTPPFANGKIVATTRDVVFPVCSPDFAANLPDAFALRDLAAVPLIASDAPESAWIGWIDWFRMAGLRGPIPRAKLQFSQYTDCISAALAGEGVALGWNLIVGQFIAKGTLVPVTDSVVEPPASYNAVVPDDRRTSAAVDGFVAWFKHVLEAGGADAA